MDVPHPGFSIMCLKRALFVHVALLVVLRVAAWAPDMVAGLVACCNLKLTPGQEGICLRFYGRKLLARRARSRLGDARETFEKPSLNSWAQYARQKATLGPPTFGPIQDTKKSSTFFSLRKHTQDL